MNLQKDNIISFEEYTALCEKEVRTPKEEMQIDGYKKYMQVRDYLQSVQVGNETMDLTPVSAQSEMNKANSYAMGLMDKPNKTEHEEQVLEDFQSRLRDNQNDNNVQLLENEGPTRKLQKAGYVDAVVLLAVILNIGFIVAMSILGGK